MNSDHLRSVCIAEKVYAEMPEILQPGRSEKEIAAIIRKRLKFFGAKKESFRIIVASGRNSAKIHGFAGRRRLKEKEIVMVDMGALFKGWRSDITRTYVLGKPTKKQEKIYNVLKKAQNAGIRHVKAGIKCSIIDKIVRGVIKKEGYGKYFIHSTGHGVGQKVHQAPAISRKSRAILKKGDIITIEPGIYFKGRGGMRIEDMVLVSAKGCKVLTSVNRSLML